MNLTYMPYDKFVRVWIDDDEITDEVISMNITVLDDYFGSTQMQDPRSIHIPRLYSYKAEVVTKVRRGYTHFIDHTVYEIDFIVRYNTERNGEAEG